MKGTTMISKLMNSHFGMGDTLRLLAVQLLLVAILIATLITVQSRAAYADTGEEAAQTQTTLEIQAPDDLNPDNGESIKSGNCFMTLCIPM